MVGIFGRIGNALGNSDDNKSAGTVETPGMIGKVVGNSGGKVNGDVPGTLTFPAIVDGKPGCTKSCKPELGMKFGGSMLRLCNLVTSGTPVDNGINPGSVVAGLRGVREVRDGYACGGKNGTAGTPVRVVAGLSGDGNNGTVGTPVLGTFPTVDGFEAIESPERLDSIPVGGGGNDGREFDEES